MVGQFRFRGGGLNSCPFLCEVVTKSYGPVIFLSCSSLPPLLPELMIIGVVSK